jgi:undecaprenyl-diphosphatase
MIFVGNCEYQPDGFAPAWRERLDDGLLDIRIIDAAIPLSRVRLVAALLLGRLATCAAYTRWTASELPVRSLDGPLRLARDGETFDGPSELVIRKRPKPIAVYAPGS